MKKAIILSFLVLSVISMLSFSKDSLRSIYSRPPSEWPKPTIDNGVEWSELSLLLPSPLANPTDSVKKIIELGKALFFDTRLSGSGKISCATCHQPEKHWTDGKEKSEGHEGAITKRNAPTIQNTWFYTHLFWDGRSKDLQDQAFAPINSETEMHSEMHDVMRKLSKSKGYKKMFKDGFGSDDIDPFVLTEAIATFEKTITSGESKFDRFLKGDKRAISNTEIRGLHLFRTKARCMNCHNGPMFTDNKFHRNNITFTYDDDGLYKVTHKEEDKRKFKTPSLRNVAHTGPWMHNGKMTSLEHIISRYSTAKYPPDEASPLLKGLGLSSREQKDLLAFLKAISAPPLPFQKPVLPD